MVRVGQSDALLLITTDHPVMYDGDWVLPINLPNAQLQTCHINSMYNVVLRDRCSIEVGGVECCTLGQPVSMEQINQAKGPEPFYGTENVIQWLKGFSSYPYVATSMHIQDEA